MARLSLVDPLRHGALWGEKLAHEAGHCAGAIALGFEFDHVVMDPHGDDGWSGQVVGLRRPPVFGDELDDVREWLAAFDAGLYRDALDRSAVARLGVMCTIEEPWDGPGAAADRAIVESNRPRDFQPGVWDLVVEHRADRVRRAPGFRLAHSRVTGELERTGELAFADVQDLVGEISL